MDQDFTNWMPMLMQLQNDLFGAETVDELLVAIDRAVRFRDVYQFLKDRLQEAVGSESAPVSPDYGMEVLAQLERQISQISDLIAMAKALRVGLPQGEKGGKAQRAAEVGAYMAKMRGEAAVDPVPPDKPPPPSPPSSAPANKKKG